MEKLIPNHLGIILDGNGRWATSKGLSRSDGHKEGAKTVEEIALYAFDQGVKYLSLYAFSTENLKRPEQEKNFLFKLFNDSFVSGLNRLHERDVKVIFSGTKKNLPKFLVLAMNNLEKKSKNGKNGTLNICINYGGRDELVHAYKSMLEKNIQKDDVTEETIRENLFHNLPDIDLMIRTSGEERISNFMLFLLSYSELYFTSTFWPDFKKEDLDKAFEEFTKRNRRFGK